MLPSLLQRMLAAMRRAAVFTSSKGLSPLRTRAVALNVVASPSVLYGMHTAAGRVFRPLYIDLIAGKPISAHPVEAAAETPAKPWSGP
jgi:hypothetical protein